LPGPDIRPTADRLRETLFNVLTAGDPDALVGSIWADLYAGTGAVGIEALSRSAGHVYFIESSRPAVHLIQQNLDALQIKAGFDLLHSDASQGLRALQVKEIQFDYVFLDPPYRLEREYEKTLQLLGTANLQKQEGVVIAEHSKKLEPIEVAGQLKRYRRLVQGDAALSFYSRSERKPSQA